MICRERVFLFCVVLAARWGFIECQNDTFEGLAMFPNITDFTGLPGNSSDGNSSSSTVQPPESKPDVCEFASGVLSRRDSSSSAVVSQAATTGSIAFRPRRVAQSFEICTTFDAREFRTFDGSCNHVYNWGKVNRQLRRLLPPDYQDSINAIRTHGVGGIRLPSATEVSRHVHQHDSVTIPRPAMFMQWGQFLDHDIILTPVFSGDHAVLKCCTPGGFFPPNLVSMECAPIYMHRNDLRFKGNCMEFVRSLAARKQCGGQKLPREQINELTAFIDGSNIYGSDNHVMWELREGTKRAPQAKLKMSAGRLLPQSEVEDCQHKEGRFCFRSGDERVNEQPGLVVMHTIWARLHNIIVDGLRPHRTSDSEEYLFQLARKIVIALMQHVHFKEWLPKVLGPNIHRQYRLYPGSRTDYSGHTDPRITNAFATAAFRFGHSLIPSAYNVSGRLIPLRQLFFRTDLVFEDFEGIVKALVLSDEQSKAQKVDRHIVSEVTDHLFEPKDQSPLHPSKGFDLPAMNIQRGRDHGLPPYNQYRKLCGLRPISSFSEFGIFGIESLSHVYRVPDDIDLFTGGLLEEPVEGGSVGPTFACIIAQQFHALKFGDRFYYETKRLPEGFSDAQLNAIRNQTLARVICRASSQESIQSDAFSLSHPTNNPDIDCSSVRSNFMDFSVWA